MDRSLLWRAALVQALAVGLLFALLVLAPLPEGFFRDNGAAIGPAAWVLASLVAGRVLGLALRHTLLAALVGGLAAGALGALAGHTAGLVAGITVFAMAAAGFQGRWRNRTGPTKRSQERQASTPHVERPA